MPDITVSADVKTPMSEEDYNRVINRTADDIRKTRKKDCAKCIYLKGASSTRPISSAAASITTYCDYITIEGKCRPCFAGDCRKAGVFKRKPVHKEKKEDTARKDMITDLEAVYE